MPVKRFSFPLSLSPIPPSLNTPCHGAPLWCSGSGRFRGMGSISYSVQWVKGSNIAIAAARIQSLAQEPPNATGAAIKIKTTNSLSHQPLLATTPGPSLFSLQLPDLLTTVHTVPRTRQQTGFQCRCAKPWQPGGICGPAPMLSAVLGCRHTQGGQCLCV